MEHVIFTLGKSHYTLYALFIKPSLSGGGGGETKNKIAPKKGPHTGSSSADFTTMKDL